jgi:hypothetical protein
MQSLVAERDPQNEGEAFIGPRWQHYPRLRVPLGQLLFPNGHPLIKANVLSVSSARGMLAAKGEY